jgi:hypothetical protein
MPVNGGTELMTWSLEDLTPGLRVRLTRAARHAHDAEQTAVSVHDVVRALSLDIDEALPAAVTGSRRQTLTFVQEIDLALDRCVQERKDGKVTTWRLAVALADRHLDSTDANMLARIIETRPGSRARVVGNYDRRGPNNRQRRRAAP